MRAELRRVRARADVDCARLFEEDVEHARQPNRRGWAGKRIVIELSPTLYQRRQLHGLPRCPRARLRALIAYQAERYFPRPAGKLVVDAKWDRSAEKAGLAIAVAAEESMLSQLVLQAKAANLTVKDIVPAGETGGMPLSLLPEAERIKLTRAMQGAMFRTALVTAVLVLMCLASRYLAMRHRVHQYEAELARLRPVVEQARRLEQSLEMASAEKTALGEAGAARKSLAVLLDAVSSVGQRDSVLLTGFSFRARGHARIELVALSAAGVVDLLNAGVVEQPWRISEGPALIDRGGERWTRLVVEQGGSPP